MGVYIKKGPLMRAL